MDNRMLATNYQAPAAQAEPAPIELEKTNVLVTAATPLMTLITQIKHTADQQNVTKFRAQVIEEVKSFTQNIQQSGYQNDIIMAARYCLCTALDEAVLGRPWGTQSVWVQECLLSYFHKETWGGENFYVIIHNLSEDPRRHIDFLELAYALLSLGFEGKFFDKQTAIREDIRNRLFYRIRNARKKPDRTIARAAISSIQAASCENKREIVKRLSIFTLITLGIISILFNSLTYQKAAPTVKKLDNIATVSPVTEFSQIINRPIISRGNSQ